MNSDKTDAPHHFVPSRREFLAMTSAAALGAATSSFASTLPRIPGVDSGAMPVLSVGYWDGLVRGDGSAVPSSRISEAVPGRGDNLFRGASAMVTVQGFWRAPARRGVPVTFSLLPIYPVTDPSTGKRAAAIGWSASLDENGVRGPLRSRFVVPLDAAGVIDIAVEKREGGTRSRAVRGGVVTPFDQLRTVAADATTNLVLGVDAAPLPLQRGVYFIALREGTIGETADWTRLHVTELRSTDRVVPQGDGVLADDRGALPSFDYIVAAIEPWGVGGA